MGPQAGRVWRVWGPARRPAWGWSAGHRGGRGEGQTGRVWGHGGTYRPPSSCYNTLGCPLRFHPCFLLLSSLPLKSRFHLRDKASSLGPWGVCVCGSCLTRGTRVARVTPWGFCWSLVHPREDVGNAPDVSVPSAQCLLITPVNTSLSLAVISVVSGPKLSSL